jgi:hypothetical protein
MNILVGDNHVQNSCNWKKGISFFLGAIHEKHDFKYFKNLTVKVCKIWWNDVYMYILYCDIFWWKLIARIFFNQIFNTRLVSRGIPPFSNCNCFARDSPRKNEIVKEIYYALILCCFFICEIKKK